MILAFVDANVPIYAAGRSHPLKGPCVAVLELIADRPYRFVTSAEVLQELLHYYLARRLMPEGGTVVESFAQLMAGRIEPVTAEDVLEACQMAIGGPEGVPARDFLHASVARRVGARHIISADRDFERVPGINRLDPTQVNEWRKELEGHDT